MYRPSHPPRPKSISPHHLRLLLVKFPQELLLRAAHFRLLVLTDSLSQPSRATSAAHAIGCCILERMWKFWCVDCCRPAFLVVDGSMACFWKITDAQKTSLNASSPYIAYVIKTGVWMVSFSLGGSMLTTFAPTCRMPKLDIDIRSSSRYEPTLSGYILPLSFPPFLRNKQLETMQLNRQKPRRMPP
jgi:hypothetical protein